MQKKSPSVQTKGLDNLAYIPLQNGELLIAEGQVLQSFFRNPEGILDTDGTQSRIDGFRFESEDHILL